MHYPSGFSFITREKFNADYDNNILTRKCRIVFIVHENFISMFWFIKNYESLKSSSLGSEFISMNEY